MTLPLPVRLLSVTAILLLSTLQLACRAPAPDDAHSQAALTDPAQHRLAEESSDASDGSEPEEDDLDFDSFADKRDRLTEFLRSYLRSEWELNPQQARPLSNWLVDYSLEYEVDPLVQAARILRESGGEHYRRSSWNSASRRIKRGGAGEYGYSQIMPFWAGKTVEGEKITHDHLRQPEGNVRAGILIYRRYAKHEDGHLMALTRYNNPRANYVNGYARAVDRIYQDVREHWKDYLKENPPGQTTTDNEPPVRAAPVLR